MTNTKQPNQTRENLALEGLLALRLSPPNIPTISSSDAFVVGQKINDPAVGQKRAFNSISMFSQTPTHPKFLPGTSYDFSAKSENNKNIRRIGICKSLFPEMTHAEIKAKLETFRSAEALDHVLKCYSLFQSKLDKAEILPFAISVHSKAVAELFLKNFKKLSARDLPRAQILAIFTLDIRRVRAVLNCVDVLNVNADNIEALVNKARTIRRPIDLLLHAAEIISETSISETSMNQPVANFYFPRPVYCTVGFNQTMGFSYVPWSFISTNLISSVRSEQEVTPSILPPM